MKKTIFLLLLCSLLFEKAEAWLVVMPKHRKMTHGFAITAANDTLSGYFLIVYGKRILYTQQPDGKKEELPSGHIRSLFLELTAQHILNKSGLIEYNFLNRYKAFYRKIYSGKFEYYDANTTYYAADRIYKVIIADLLHGTDTLVDPDIRSAKKELIDFLNKTYKTNFGYHQFDNSIQVIREIERHAS